MQQLEIQYFFPLTEQISLDLDYTPCIKFNEERLAERIASSAVSNCTLAFNGSSPVWTMNNTINPSIVIFADKTPITIKTDEKPSIFARWIYKILGVKWEKA